MLRSGEKGLDGADGVVSCAAQCTRGQERGASAGRTEGTLAIANTVRRCPVQALIGVVKVVADVGQVLVGVVQILAGVVRVSVSVASARVPHTPAKQGAARDAAAQTIF